MAATDTAPRVLDVAEELVQTRGFNGFSYADVAAQVGVTKAALHYHFPGKAELGERLIDRYAARFAEALAEIDASGAPPRAGLAAYAALYGRVLRRERMCLCGILAAEYQTLPAPMQRAVTRFFDANEAWLAAVLESGRDAGELAFEGSPREAARALIAGLEGAMLVARAYGEPDRFDAAASRLLAAL